MNRGLHPRPPSAGDRHSLFAIYPDTEVTRYLSRLARQTMRQADAWIAASKQGWPDHTQWRFAVIEQAGGVCIGICQLFHIDEVSARAGIGYVLDREHRGHGYMSEAVRGVVGWAMDRVGLRRIETEIDPANRSSARLLTRAGFVCEGRLRECWRVDGRLSDSDMYGLLTSDRRTAE